MLDEDVPARFEGRRIFVLTHVAAGSVALLVGPFPLWLGLRGGKRTWHRPVGKLHFLAIALSSLSALYLAATTQLSWIFGAGLAGLGVAWVLTTGLACIAIRRRQYQQHMEWMIRSDVVTLGFVFFRLFVGVTSAMEVGTLFERLNAASWICWALPLLVAEVVLQGRKVFSSMPAG